MKKLFIFLIITGIAGLASAQYSFFLIKDGKSDHQLWLNEPNNKELQAVAKLFNSYFEKISGAKLKYRNTKEMIGSNIAFILMKNNGDPAFSDEGFCIETMNTDNIVFGAYTAKGLENAVYTFLEKYMHCRYYARDAIVIPEIKNLEINPIYDIANPVFSFRVIYYYEAFQEGYAKWHKLSNCTKKTDKGWQISDNWGMWVHTMHRLVPPDIYFSKHPEYYALRNGIRVKDQLCLSNPEVLKITIESLKKEIAKNPKAKYWSVSQMDNYSYCQCDKCREIDSIEGSPSGSIIRFANAVAENFPDKIISTLAYQYSRQVPKITKPLSTVNIMLCSIECERSKPINYYGGAGSFTKDLESWAKVSSNILVWDYLINFNHLVNPFPNFQVLEPNIRLFALNKVNMLFEQGYADKCGEFNELRCYMLAKLMWDATADPDTLMNDFLNGYYGAAGPFIRQYIDLETAELLKSGLSLGTEPPVNHVSGFLSPANIDAYFKIFENAKNAVKDDESKLLRVNIAMNSVRYAWLEVCKSIPFTPDWVFSKNNSGEYMVKEEAIKMLNDFKDIADRSGLKLTHETKLPPQEYYDAMMNYFKYGCVKHLALNKPIRFEIPCDPKYAATPGCLVDGVHGTSDYQIMWQGWYGKDVIATIDLEKDTVFSEIKVTCMDDSQSWIFLPKDIQVETSIDGITWTKIFNIANENWGKKIEKQNRVFSWMSADDIETRYIRLTIVNIGNLPAWRGENGKAWLFVDEIEVN
jgi:hypothetical protein